VDLGVGLDGWLDLVTRSGGEWLGSAGDCHGVLRT
jgi:hypothetical protein